MKHISRSYSLWISASIASVLLYFFAFHFFPQTFPLIHLNITMDREQALEYADTIAQKNNLGPLEYHRAALFHTDEATKTFIELEAGGNNALVTMMEEKLYIPYTWMVRHFKEHEKNESLILFTPDGTPYGFTETLSESTSGAQLSEDTARKLAQREAEKDWNIDFTLYQLVESSQKTELSKRIDHTFVYERTDKKIGDGFYRLKIVISGDKITELRHFIKVPEAFTRRYTEMRSQNSLVSFISRIIIFLLYILGGLIGLYWIFRNRQQIIQQPLIIACILALLSSLTVINQLPSIWMQYNSALSTNIFLIQKLIFLCISFIFSSSFYTVIIMAAENLTRCAFGNHPQLWSVFSYENSASYAILGRIWGSYLLVGFNIAFVIAFYLFSFRYLGWWSPSETLFDPNILATYAPWFSPLALSINAGFIEECLFRAIPLAGAALLGKRFGKPNWWMGITLILQALIFGAAHADYPQTPSYARMVEMFIPSIIWGIIYLSFGLLPTIICHYVYDVIWFSIPLFIMQTSDTFLYKMIIILGIFLPLLIILTARLKKGRWIELSAASRNASWQPDEKTHIVEEKAEESIKERVPKNISAQSKKLIFCLGAIGLLGWILTTRFTHDGINISIHRDTAVNLSNTFLQDNGINLTAPWQTLPLMFTDYKSIPQIASQHIFIWKKGKKELYDQLLGTYLQPAHWTIRYAQFDTDIIKRAEEYKIMLYDNTIWRVHHQLPESTTGASLTQQQARLIAHKELEKKFNLDPEKIKEISAIQTQLLHRINWLFVFADEDAYPLSIGQARISVAIAGNEVIDVERTIHVPEEWERKYQNKELTLNIIVLISYLMFLLFLFIGIIYALRSRRSFIFSKKMFFSLLSLFSIICVIDLLNSWPVLIGSLNTSLPIQNQLFQLIVSYGIIGLLKAVFYAIVTYYILLFQAKHQKNISRENIGIGISCGFFMAGLLSCAAQLMPLNVPLWPDYTTLSYALPLLASLLHCIMYYIQITSAFCLLYILIDNITNQWKKKYVLAFIITTLCGMHMIDLPSLSMLPFWILSGSVIGYILILLYQRILYNSYCLIPLATASFSMLKLLQEGLFNPYPGIIIETIANIVIIFITSTLWYLYTNRKTT